VSPRPLALSHGEYIGGINAAAGKLSNSIEKYVNPWQSFSIWISHAKKMKQNQTKAARTRRIVLKQISRLVCRLKAAPRATVGYND
jgi:hypothetical protein